MGILHFLDIGPGDCSIIKHASARITVIDVCRARSVKPAQQIFNALLNSLSPPPAQPSLGALLSGPHAPPPQEPTLGSVFGSLASALVPNPLDWGTPILSGVSKEATLGAILGRSAPPLSPSVPFQAALEALRRNPPTSAAANDYENPIAYMTARSLHPVFRQILSHTDMDHMDGLADLYEEFPPANFWDTSNTCKKTFGPGSPYREKDWLLYKSLRDGTALNAPTRLTLYAGDRGKYFNNGGEDGSQDGLFVLAPTHKLVSDANARQDFNDCSYVILYRSAGGRILFCGDSHDKTWEHILAWHLDDVIGVDLMIAPHHGRHSDRDWDFLRALQPKLTLFGRAPSEHLAYGAWSNLGLPYITSNQAGNVIVDTDTAPMQVFVAKEAFARKRNPYTWFSDYHKAWFLQDII